MQKQLLLIAVLVVLSFFNAVGFAKPERDEDSGSSSSSQVTLTAVLPSVVVVKVDNEKSNLSKTLEAALIDSNSNKVSQDFSIFGDVLANDNKANVQCTVSTTKLQLVNGKSAITVNLSGNIGGAEISEKAMTPKFSNKKASISISGDIDDTTVTSSLDPGSYSGTLTITATLL